MTLPITDQTPEDILDQLIDKDQVKAAAPFQKLVEFMQAVSPYTRSLILNDFEAAVGRSKLDAITLTGEDISLEVADVDGKPDTIQQPDELIRCDEKALNWRAKKEKQAEKNWMLHTGQIREDHQQLVSDQGRFDELLALRREFARQQSKPKTPTAAAPKKAAPRNRKAKKPAQ